MASLPGVKIEHNKLEVHFTDDGIQKDGQQYVIPVALSTIFSHKWGEVSSDRLHLPCKIYNSIVQPKFEAKNDSSDTPGPQIKAPTERVRLENRKERDRYS